VGQSGTRLGVDEFTQAILSPNWLESRDAQVETFVSLNEQMNSGFGKEVVEATIVPVLAERMGWTTQRVMAVLALQEVVLVRRALRFDGQDKAKRAKEERLYPYDGFIGDYLLWAQNMEVPLSYHFWLAVVGLGAACRRNYYLERGNTTLYLNHYVMLLGRSSLRKSVPLDALKPVVDRANEIIEEKHDLFPEDMKLVLLPSQATPQRLVQLMQCKRRSRWGRPGFQESEGIGLFLCDEMVSLIGKGVFGSSELIQNLTSWYSFGQGYWTRQTLARGEEKILNPTLSMVGCSTLDWLRTSVTEDMFKGGFLGRSVFVHRNWNATKDRIYSTSQPLDPVGIEHLSSFLAEVIVPEKGNRKRCIELTQEAEEWHHHWYLRHRKVLEAEAHDDKIDPFMGRWQNHMLKLAGVLAVSQDPHKPEISLTLLKQAHAIIKDEENRLPEIFALVEEGDDSRKVRRVREFLKRRGGVASRSDIMRGCQHYVGNSQVLDRVMHTLEVGDEIGVEKRGRRRVYTLLSEVGPELQAAQPEEPGP
jgi:hypothetical protein